MDADKQEINNNSADYDLFGDIGTVDYTDGSNPLNDISCSPEDYNVLVENQQPADNQWRDVEAPSPYNTSATIDCARQQLWEQGKLEIAFVRNKVKKALAALGKSEASIDNLVDLIFGPRSNIGHLLAEKLTDNKR
jgi:hypothetical protein